ncbi:MAG: hypothetical protein AB1403_17120 [Candidatus Riflebacteria bacterium]
MSEIENIIQELGVPLKTFRIFAIEKAIRAGKSPELLAALKNCLAEEVDQECRLLLEHAIASNEERLGLTGKTTGGEDNEKLLENFSVLTPRQQLDFIKRATRQYFLSEGSTRVARILQSASHPVVIAELINKCQSSWPADQLEFLEKNLFSTSSVLQLACVEAVIHNSSEILQRNFEKLVLASDPLLRALAIRGLARSFPESAADFLAECLRKGDFYGRLAALRVCSVMPFDLVKSSLLELINSEKDAKLLKISAAIIVSNPDKEIPFRLCEMMARSDNDQAKFLQDLIKKCCELIRIAEICSDFSAYFASVQKYNQQVRARFVLLNFAESFSHAPDEEKARMREAFKKKSGAAEMAEALEELKKTNPVLIKDLLEDQPEKIKNQERVESPADKEESQKPVQDQAKMLLRELLRSQTEKVEGITDLIQQGFAGSNPDLIAASLRAAKAVKDNRWVARAKTSVKNENEDIVAAAFDYLAEFDSDSFLLLLRGFINTPSILVRTVLLRNVCRLSGDMARELLLSMLNDSQATTREKALSSIIHFDFASIREILTGYMARETSEELIVSCLSFYQANPVLESVYDLKILEERQQFSKIFANARETVTQMLDELKIANPEEVFRYIQERTQKDEQKPEQENSQKNRKKLDAIRGKVNWKAAASEEKAPPINIFAALKVAGFLLVLVIGVIWFMSSGSSTTSTRKAVNTVPLAGTMQDYQLIVQKVDSVDGALIGLTADKKYIRAIPRPGKLFMVEAGDRIRLKALPFKIAPDGTTIVKTISIKKEK